MKTDISLKFIEAKINSLMNHGEKNIPFRNESKLAPSERSEQRSEQCKRLPRAPKKKKLNSYQWIQSKNYMFLPGRYIDDRRRLSKIV